MAARLRDSVAVSMADFAARAARSSGHRATTLPGVVAERIAPGVTSRLVAGAATVVVVSGTNGKTTTTRLIVDLLDAAGRRTVSNPSGANLLAGVTSTFISHREAVSSDDPPIVVLEVDEMSLDRIAAQVPINILVTTNLVRDQLDRYGETDAIIRRWRPVVQNLPSTSTLIVCADDARLVELARHASAQVESFGLAQAPPSADADPFLTPEAVSCPACDGRVVRHWVGLGHLGDYSCASCGFKRPAPSITARIDESRGFAGSVVTLRDSRRGLNEPVNLVMPGVSNAYNAAAAMTAVAVLGVPIHDAIRSLADLRPPWGRYERVVVDGREVILALGKNPASVAELVRIGASSDIDSVIVGVNDAIADGRDASWYWDVDLSALLAGRAFRLTGTRRLDLALRLKYGSLDAADALTLRESIVDTPARALAGVVAATPRGGRIFAILTYTALLELRALLAERRLVAPMPA